MNEKFIEYFRKNFFENEDELKIFLSSLSKHLKKTIRVNTNKIGSDELVERMKNLGYDLNPTFSKNVFYIERGENFDEIERRLGFSLEHLMGYFYIQELGASSSVFYLSDGVVDKKPYLILDMASSPGGKTTQLAEFYPNSFIVANEFSRDRTAQLIANIERMGNENIGITCYNGQFIGRLTETFDKILLDAPCSGEGIGFKAIETLRYWNLKNVKKIADLQEKLFESGLNALKVGGEMLYSTCTMNKIEDEGVVGNIMNKYPGSFEISFEKRFWPHIDNTGGFFVCRIKKLSSIDYRFSPKFELCNEDIKELSNNDRRIIEKFSKEKGLDLENHSLLNYKGEILAMKSGNSYKEIQKRLYFIRLGKKIGKIEKGEFTPNYYLGRDFELAKVQKYDIKDQMELDNFLRGMEIGENLKDGIVQIRFDNINIGLGFASNSGRIKNIFPKLWLRK
ncbi:MAG: hypothetical protein PHS92_03270 [Candidatus Gracilibacteria bacterium]|nr:hypothetical protein [Candidatus Gracilibacteria bacterium]